MNTIYAVIDGKNEYTGEEKASLDAAARVIREGGLVAFPTETVYGLGGCALYPDAAKKIYAAKGRPSDNPLIVHLASSSQAGEYCETTELYRKIAHAFMPGPITVIMKKKPIIPDEVTGGLDTVAIRVPSDPVAHAFLDACALPVAAPSANTSGRPSPTKALHVREDMDGKIEMIIDGGDCEIGLESTIVSIFDGNIRLLRPGAVTIEMLATACPDTQIIDCTHKKYAPGETPEAPGMKYRHYAPRASVVILSGESSSVRDYMASHSQDERVGIICYDEDLSAIKGDNIKSLGARDAKAEHAKRLFAILREFDSFENVNTIYAPLPTEEGIGMAVCNRLIKAAGFTVIKV